MDAGLFPGWAGSPPDVPSVWQIIEEAKREQTERVWELSEDA